MEKSFSYSAASLWNGSSNEAKESGISIKEYKTYSWRHLTQHGILSCKYVNIGLNAWY